MKPIKLTDPEFVVRKSDYYKIELIDFGIIMPFFIAALPLLLPVKPLFVYIIFGGLFVFFLRDLIYYLRAKQSDSTLLKLDSKGVYLENKHLYSWDKIEYLKVRYVIGPPLDMFWLVFCVKPNNENEIRISINNNYSDWLPIIRRKVQRIVDHVGKPGIFIYDIPPFWQRFYRTKNKDHYRN